MGGRDWDPPPMRRQGLGSPPNKWAAYWDVSAHLPAMNPKSFESTSLNTMCCVWGGGCVCVWVCVCECGMSVFMCVCVCIVCNVCVYVGVWAVCACLYICVCVCVHCVCVFEWSTCVFMCVCVFIYIYIHVSWPGCGGWVCVCVVYMCVCVYVCVCASCFFFHVTCALFPTYGFFFRRSMQQESRGWGPHTIACTVSEAQISLITPRISTPDIWCLMRGKFITGCDGNSLGRFFT